ncbi:MAG TPA: tetratricopeptide repeat protein [Phycisphaerae bacterium]|nr:tetratricopeptide repeat protein [Phycisphaerae bacterium]
MALNIVNEEDTFQAGIVAQRTGKLAEAQQHYQQVLRMNPRRAAAYQNLGILAFQVGRFEDSIKLLEKARELGLETPGLFCGMGDAYAVTNRWEEALAWYQKAMDADPQAAGAYNNAGAVLLKLGRVGEAVAAWEEVVALAQKSEAREPEGSPRAAAFRRFAAAAYNNLGEAYLQRGSLDLARENHQRALDSCPTFAPAHSNLLRDTLYAPDIDDLDVIASHDAWWDQHTAGIVPVSPQRDRSPDRKLRVGFVSGNFYEHALFHFLLPLFERHDREQLEFIGYSNVRQPDEWTLKLIAHCEGGWRNIVGLADESAARMIDDDRVDILIDLSGHTADHRLALFAHRPAPIQATWLGYPLTLGGPIDYRLADPFADDADAQSQYAERLVRLPRTGWCYRPPQAMADVDVPVTPPVLRGKPGERPFTFGAFAGCPRISDEAVRLWAGALNAVPHSRLFLKARPMDDRETRRAFRARFAAHGIDAERLTFLVRQPALKDHLIWYRKIDVMLDTMPFSGLANTCDALWLGVPVISFAGRTARMRTGASLLTQLGLEKLVAHSETGFVHRAAQLAKDLPLLEKLRAALRRRMEKSPLRDEAAFAGDFATALRGMWRAWCADGGAA